MPHDKKGATEVAPTESNARLADALGAKPPTSSEAGLDVGQGEVLLAVEHGQGVGDGPPDANFQFARPGGRDDSPVTLEL